MGISQYYFYLVNRYGLLPIVLILVLILEATFFIFYTIPKHQDLNKMMAENLKPIQHHQIALDDQVNSNAYGIDNFYQILPDESKLYDELATFFDDSFENDIYLDSVDYKIDDKHEVGYSKVILTLPTTGTYLNIRKFVKKVMLGMPNVSLDSIDLTRENSQDVEINAKLQFTVFLKTNMK